MPEKLFDIDAFRAQPLPTEAEIMDSWQGDCEKPVVSVLCNTFNQATYIEDAFRGFLIQKTDFVFEVIVHDDASTDGTSDIVREYAKRYPQIFKIIIQTENQYSQGKRITLLSAAHAKGDFFALCEGDDFWSDEKKLQKQLLALRNHSEIMLCFTPGFGLSNSGVLKKVASYGSKEVVFSTPQVIRGGGGFMPTASLFFHRNVIINIPSWFNIAPVGDYYLQILSSIDKGALYIPCVTCIYRENAVNSWTSGLNKRSFKQIINDKNNHLYCLNNIRKQLGIDEEIDFALAREYMSLTVIALKSKHFSLARGLINESFEYKKITSYQLFLYKAKSFYPFIYLGFNISNKIKNLSFIKYLRGK